MSNLLPPSFYERDDVVRIARELLGMRCVSRVGGVPTAGEIVETEAYRGHDDRACHACDRRTGQTRPTPRTATMFGPAGRAYVYLCYGIHHLLNVVTNRAGRADAVLIRGLYPAEGLDVMRERRNHQPNLTTGPGNVTQALGITTAHNGLDLRGDTLWIEDRGLRPPPETIRAAPRVGVDYAGEDALRPWRFRIDPAAMTDFS
ncbi:MAG: DNA-3-methyladenine glycosylase [Catalinimonas sp.]